MKRSGYRIVGIVGAILLMSSQVIMPYAAETMLERTLKRTVSSETITAEVKALPAWMLLGGAADTITLSGQKVRIGKVLCEDVTATLSEVEIDTDHLRQDGKVLFRSVGDAQCTASITADDLAEALRHSVKQLDEPIVTVSEDGIEASGTYAFGRTRTKVSLSGRLTYRDNKIFFVSEKVRLQYGARGSFSADLRTEVELAELKNLPFAVRITEIRPTDGRILLAFQKADETKPSTRSGDSYEVENR